MSVPIPNKRILISFATWPLRLVPPIGLWLSVCLSVYLYRSHIHTGPIRGDQRICCTEARLCDRGSGTGQELCKMKKVLKTSKNSLNVSILWYRLMTKKVIIKFVGESFCFKKIYPCKWKVCTESELIWSNVFPGARLGSLRSHTHLWQAKSETPLTTSRQPHWLLEALVSKLEL